MFGLDDRIAGLSNGTTLVVVIAVSVLLGLRHASDPDHLTAVTALIAGRREQATRRAARLGFTWGLGHATSLFLFGIPVVLYSAYLPEQVQAAAETAVGFVIVALALALLVRWRRGHYRFPAHVHPRGRNGWQAFAIGLVHGMGGTAGVGLLLLATIHSRVLALAALALFAACTALSMTLLSAGFGVALSAGTVRRSFHHVAPALGIASLAFGLWYALGAQGVVPYIL
jgi:High-affinity nickel-transport protein